jgi:hypothetical protein
MQMQRGKVVLAEALILLFALSGCRTDSDNLQSLTSPVAPTPPVISSSATEKPNPSDTSPPVEVNPSCDETFREFEAATVVYSKDTESVPFLRIIHALSNGTHSMQDIQSPAWIVDYSLAWSDDGEWVAFSVETDDTPAISILDRTSGKLSQISLENLRSEAILPERYALRIPSQGFSPDRSWIWVTIRYWEGSGGPDDLLVDLENGRLISLNPDEAFLAWSKEGAAPVFHTFQYDAVQNRIVILQYRVDELTSPTVIYTAEVHKARLQDVSISPQNDRIALLDRTESLLKITSLSLESQSLTYPTITDTSLLVGPWSPDGRWVVAYQVPFDYLAFYDFQKRTVRDTSLNLAPYSSPLGWSPGGDEFYYQGGLNIFSVSPVTGETCIRGAVNLDDVSPLSELPPFLYLHFSD